MIKLKKIYEAAGLTQRQQAVQDCDYGEKKKASSDEEIRGSWVAQSVERPTSAQVMISRLMSLGPASGSVPTAQSLEPASDSVSPSLSLPLPCSHSVSLSKVNKHFKKF